MFILHLPLRGNGSLTTPLNFFSSFDHVDRSDRAGLGSALHHTIAFLRNSQRTLDHIGLLDHNLPIPVLNRPGKIEILPFLSHLHLRLWASEFCLLELGILFINHEPPQEINSSTDYAHLLRIEQLKVLRDRNPRTLDVTFISNRVGSVPHERRTIPENVTDTAEELQAPRVADLEHGIDIASA